MIILIVEVLLAVAVLGFVTRAVVGPTLVDRLVGLDGLLLSIVGLLAAESVRLDTLRYLDAMVVVGVLAFVGVAAAARFIERRGV